MYLKRLTRAGRVRPLSHFNFPSSRAREIVLLSNTALWLQFKRRFPSLFTAAWASAPPIPLSPVIASSLATVAMVSHPSPCSSCCFNSSAVAGARWRVFLMSRLFGPIFSVQSQASLQVKPPSPKQRIDPAMSAMNLLLQLFSQLSLCRMCGLLLCDACSSKRMVRPIPHFHSQ